MATIDEVPWSVPAARSAAPQWWRRPWIVPLAIVTVWFVVHQMPPYLDEATAPLMPHAGFAAYYTLLMIHIFAGTLVMLIVVLQLWPFLRQRWPLVHRWSGRVYLAATAVCGTMALIILPFAPSAGKMGAAVATITWLATSAAGYRAARQRRWVDHRRWMLYSFAVVMNNVWGVVFVGVLIPLHVDFTVLGEIARWLGLVINLALVQWWLYRSANKPLRLHTDIRVLEQSVTPELQPL